MDIYEYLKMDHQKVDYLFNQFAHADSIARQQEVLAMITRELFAHAYSEQATFYKELTNYPATKNLAMNDEQEHRKMEEQIAKISTLSGKKWEEAVWKLKEIVKDHAKKEETEVFQQAKKVLSEKDAYMIWEKMHTLKGKFLLMPEEMTTSQMPKSEQVSTKNLMSKSKGGTGTHPPKH